MTDPAALSTDAHQAARLPRSIIWAVIAICVAPFLLNLVGFDFGSVTHPFDAAGPPNLSNSELTDVLYHSLGGSFLHTILEWSAFCTAIFTVILAWVHFGIRKNDVLVPVIGVCLLCAGCMDAFHTLVADRLIDATADNTNLIPFTWALCRIFNALIMICGIGAVLWRMRRDSVRTPTWFVGITSLVFAAIAYFTIHFCAISGNLPQTMYPDAFITRPFDVAPLVMFVFAGAVIYRRLHRVAPSLFTSAVILSVIPEIAVQLHMAFGSTALFDNHFNIAHFLKVIAYLVPFVGLCMDYSHSHRRADRMVHELAQAERIQAIQTAKIEEGAAALELQNFELVSWKISLEGAVASLQNSNKELDDFAYIASHDLKEPLRGMHNYSKFLLEDYGDKLDDEGRSKLETLTRLAQRMESLINGLLYYSRVGRTELASDPCNLNDVLKDVVDSLKVTLEESGTDVRVAKPLPTMRCDRIRTREVFQNLITNAMKYNDKPERWIEVGCTEDEHTHPPGEQHPNAPVLYVRDNGIGIPNKHHDAIFSIFKRLHGRDKFGGGTGAGLTIVKKIIERHGGRIWIESIPGEGTTFYFSLSEEYIDEHTDRETNTACSTC